MLNRKDKNIRCINPKNRIGNIDERTMRSRREEMEELLRKTKEGAQRSH